jgi:hypothetical protein
MTEQGAQPYEDLGAWLTDEQLSAALDVCLRPALLKFGAARVVIARQVVACFVALDRSGRRALASDAAIRDAMRAVAAVHAADEVVARDCALVFG